MNELNVALEIIRALKSHHVEFMVTGSLASNYWGRPRSTQDVDVVLRAEHLDLSAFLAALGPEYRSDRQLQFETITATQRYVITHVPTQFKAELFALSDDPFDQSRFQRRTEGVFEDMSIPFSTPEDTVVQKLRWLKGSGTQKHREDLRSVLAVQKDNLDWDYVRRWTGQHSTNELLDEIMDSLGEEPAKS